jgi:hypothetical protein
MAICNVKIVSTLASYNMMLDHNSTQCGRENKIYAETTFSQYLPIRLEEFSEKD